MKKVLLIAWLTLVGTVGFAQNQKIQVASDKALNEDFTKFKTYAFASMINADLDPGFYFLNDLVFKSQLREAIEGELMGLGYKMDKTNPDLVVNFRVFEEPTTLHGYDGYGTGYWGNEEYRQISDKTTYEVKAGTLLISLLDRKEGQVVWQGFASGLFANNKFIKDQATVREAVSLIVNEYGVRVENYSVN